MDDGEETALLREDEGGMLDPDAVSAGKKIAQVGSSVLFCLLMVGLVFGFAALKPVLVDGGVYSELCPGGGVCTERDTRLNLLFIVASSVNNVAALPMGAFLDRAGPKITTILGGVLFAAGCLTFSVGHVKGPVDTYLAGFTLLALGSPAVFLAQFHLSNAFPVRSGLILGALTGAFDASSLPLCFYKLVYFSLGHKPSLSTFWLAYTVVPLLLIIQQFAFGPTRSYLRPAPPPVSATPETSGRRQRRSISGSARRPSASRRMSSSFSRRSYGIYDDAEDHEIKRLLEKREDGITGALFGQGVVQQILSSWWLVMEVMVVVHMTRINWYLATVNTQLAYYTGATDLADKLTDAFIFLLPLGGIVSIPFIGWLLDHRPTLDVMLIMTFMGLAFGVLTLLSSVTPQLVGIGFLVVFRPLFYTAISDYAAKVFGFQTFGTVYGLSMTVSGLFGLLLTPLDRMTKGTFRGSYTPVNVGLLLAGLLSTLVLAARVWVYTRRARGRIRLASVDNNAIIEEDEGT